MQKFLVQWLAVLGLMLAGSSLAAAQDPPDPVEDPLNPLESPWRIGVALGLGGRSNPLVLSDDIPILVNLDVAWFGKRWFFDNGDLGFTLRDRERYTIDLVGRFNSDRVFFGKTDSKFISVGDSIDDPILEKVEVPDRDYALEVGAEILADGDWGDLQLAAFWDVSGTHEGYEVFADYGYSVRRQRWSYQPSFGLSWKSSEMNNYYWGVTPDEANVLFPAYEAGPGLNFHARFLTSFQINRHWAFIAVAEYERMNQEAAASPIVKEPDVIGLFAGFKYEY